MKLRIAVLLIFGFGAGQVVRAQAAPPSENKPSQTPSGKTQKPADSANPFPEDTNNVPVMPGANAPAANIPSSAAPAAVPGGDVDPVRSPDDPRPDADTGADGFSSSASGLDRVMPPPDTDIDAQRHRKGRGAAPPEHKETAAEDEKVGNYYLDEKNWKAALSRFESALVLDPENPDVYWGMAEAQRHLGKFAEAKANYEKLVEYDPDSKHGKEAKKLLKDSQLANAAAVAKP